MNVFAEMFHAMFHLDCYVDFLRNRKRKVFLFGFLLALIYFLIANVGGYLQFQMATGGMENVMNMVMPEFEIANGKLSVDQPIEMDAGGSYLFIDTDPGVDLDEEGIDYYLGKRSAVIAADSTEMIVKSNGQIVKFEFADLGSDFTLTKESLLSFMGPYMKMITAMMGIILFIGDQISLFFSALVVALLSKIGASALHCNLPFGKIYQLSIYARTTPVLLKAVLALLPLGVPFYSLISIAISTTYMVFAMQRIMKSPGAGETIVENSSNNWT